ncbi:MAG: AraC family transcriptional regulator [Dysgonamonadaceae bacterium]|jgi:AraC-like DNA-binding protein|nr:AraC family transcriptional regulator [Dysgonamonadaceae bacterium]
MSRLLYVQEHLPCINYEHRKDAYIREERIEKAQPLDMFCQVNTIVIVVKNPILLSSDIIRQYRIAEEAMFFLPAGSRLSLSPVGEEASVLLFRFFERIRLCDSFPVERVFKRKASEPVRKIEDAEGKPFLLNLNMIAKKYLSLLLDCHRAGLRCCIYNKSKVEELLFILRGFYGKQELALFFHPLINADALFTQTVMANSLSCRSISELAEKTGYSISGFEKKFRKVFNEAPYRWMNRQRQKDIYHKLHSTSMSISQISDSLGFSSPAVFNDYVKRAFGTTPRQLQAGGNKE